MTANRGVLLLNLGTPDAPRPPEVRRYLREFLSDPRVIDLPAVRRWLLVQLVIWTGRPRRSAAAYAKVWTAEGSPLLVHSQAFAAGLRERLPEWPVALGMRYGRPGAGEALEELLAAGCDELVVFPLYPQYASSSTGTALQDVFARTARRWNVPSLRVVAPFHADPAYLDAVAATGQATLAEFDADHVLFSYHGLPERQIRKSEVVPGACRFDADCCAALGAHNRHCYRAQCHATTRGLVARLGLAPEGHSTSFQSRLGRSPWIRPYTDELLRELPARGVRRLAVLCPSFVTDCLETLEEIGLRAREDFRAAGGEELRLVPSINATPVWLDAAAAIVRRT